jgi:hypothetical protein
MGKCEKRGQQVKRCWQKRRCGEQAHFTLAIDYRYAESPLQGRALKHTQLLQEPGVCRTAAEIDVLAVINLLACLGVGEGIGTTAQEGSLLQQGDLNTLIHQRACG